MRYSIALLICLVFAGCFTQQQVTKQAELDEYITNLNVGDTFETKVLKDNYGFDAIGIASQNPKETVYQYRVQSITGSTKEYFITVNNDRIVTAIWSRRF